MGEPAVGWAAGRGCGGLGVVVVVSEDGEVGRSDLLVGLAGYDGGDIGKGVGEGLLDKGVFGYEASAVGMSVLISLPSQSRSILCHS